MDWHVSYSTKQKRVALLVRCARVGSRRHAWAGPQARARRERRGPCGALRHMRARARSTTRPAQLSAGAGCAAAVALMPVLLCARATAQQAGPLPVRPAHPHGERRAELHDPHHHLQPPWCAPLLPARPGTGTMLRPGPRTLPPWRQGPSLGPRPVLASLIVLTWSLIRLERRAAC